MRKLLKDRSGSMFVYLLIILFFLFTFTGLVGEVYRVHSIQTHVEYEIQRAANIAVEEAMQDSWRQDGTGHLDITRAKQNVTDYFSLWLGLNAALEKIQSGAVVYRLQLDPITATVNPPRLAVRGRIFITGAFPLLASNAEIPFSISSRNVRLD